MSLPELIREYHSRKLLPVFNKAAHELFFRKYVDGYSSDGLPALERFASNSGFKIITEDFDFRYVFIPGERPSDYEEYQREDVPIEKPPDA